MLKKSSKNHKFSKAFTIPELLVVITVIAILVLLAITQMQPSRAKGRDSKRVSEINTLRVALQLYYMGHDNKYPKSTPNEKWCSIEGEINGRLECQTSFYQKISPYLSEIPGDPLFPRTEGEKIYSYQYRSVSSGDGYMLHTDLETRDPYELSSLIGEKEIVYYFPGADFLYEYYDTGITCIFEIADDQNVWVSQSFTVGNVGPNEDFFITKVKLHMGRWGEPPNLLVSIREANPDGSPKDTDLSSGTVDLTTWPEETPDWYEISMTSYKLLAEGMYAIVATVPGSDFQNNVRWYCDIDAYTGGDAFYSVDGSTWVAGGQDAGFEVYGQP